nr:hypothetical protein [Pectobacterium parmentieri]
MEWVDPFGLDKKGAASQVQINRANGKAWERDVTQAAKDKYRAENVHEQVYIRPLDASGKPADYRVIVDNAIRTPDGSLKLVDAKASSTAGFTKNQTKGYPLIGKHGGIIESGSMKGTVLPATKVSRIDPSTIGRL